MHAHAQTPQVLQIPVVRPKALKRLLASLGPRPPLLGAPAGFRLVAQPGCRGVELLLLVFHVPVCGVDLLPYLACRIGC